MTARSSGHLCYIIMCEATIIYLNRLVGYSESREIVYIAMAPKTRAVTVCPVFGTPCELRDCVLPTYRDVMRYYLFLRHNEVGARASTFKVASKIAERLETIWKKASIPVVTSKPIVIKINTYYKKYEGLMKSYKSRYGKSAKYDEQFNTFVEDSLKLLDIASCKCASDCSCPREHKVHPNERAFLIDQRSERKIVIGGIDAKETSVAEKKEKRKKEEL